ncbi:hypothetical protein Acsp03_70970 [Actinomadura sp. NBRC 104412]|nr:hypothetical protein Acsp03_70970 [Actinomadura sp. NBRC 104412]
MPNLSGATLANTPNGVARPRIRTKYLANDSIMRRDCAGRGRCPAATASSRAASIGLARVIASLTVAEDQTSASHAHHAST